MRRGMFVKDHGWTRTRIAWRCPISCSSTLLNSDAASKSQVVHSKPCGIMGAFSIGKRGEYGLIEQPPLNVHPHVSLFTATFVGVGWFGLTGSMVIGNSPVWCSSMSLEKAPFFSQSTKSTINGALLSIHRSIISSLPPPVVTCYDPVAPEEEMQTQRREEAKEIMSQECLGDHGRMGPSVGRWVESTACLGLIGCLCQGNSWDIS